MMSFGQNYWTKTSNVSKENLAQRWVQPKESVVYEVNLDKIKSDLSKVPQRFSTDESHIVTFPNSDGQFKEYIVQEASVMEPELQAKYPELRSYIGWQKNHPENTIRFSITPEEGISIMYYDGWKVSYLDKLTKNHSQYQLY